MASPQPTPTTPPIDANEAARIAVDVATDRQAADIVMIDIHDVSGFADFLVIMTGNSVRQLNALASEIEEGVEKAGLDLHHREGTSNSGWVLLDFGDLVVHVFSEELRERYKLEQIWKAGKQVVRIQ